MALAARLPDPSALAELRRTTGLRQVVVQTAEIAEPEKAAVWRALADAGTEGALALIARDGDTFVFAVREPASPATR